MEIKFIAIIGMDACLKAVERNGYALRYVLEFELFVKIAGIFNIEVVY